MRYIITVDRALLDSDPSNPRVIRVEDTALGTLGHYESVRLLTRLDDRGDPEAGGAPVIRYGPARQDGARVWIECNAWEGE